MILTEQKTVTLARRVAILTLLTTLLIVTQARADFYYDFAKRFDPPGKNLGGDAIKLGQNFVIGLITGLILVAMSVAFVSFAGGIGGLILPALAFFFFVAIPSKIGFRLGYASFCAGLVVVAVILLLMTLEKKHRDALGSFTKRLKPTKRAAPAKKKKCRDKTVRNCRKHQPS